MKERFTTTSNKDTDSTTTLVAQQQQSQPPQDDDAPWRKALTRSLASFGTWFITEYPKLIFQQQQQQQQQHDPHSNKYPLTSIIKVYRSTSISNHVRSALSSAAQRGSSAMIMFYGQAYISQALVQLSSAQATNNHTHNNKNNDWKTAGLAGFLGGACSSLVHTMFEPIKIRHEPFCWNVYRASLWPMMWRHALFDGTFFATSALLESYNQQQNDTNDYATDKTPAPPKQQHILSYATIFGVSALAASTVNLTHDLWKTQFIKALPHRLKWMSVVQSLSVSSFRQQWIMKAADLGFNWWVTGLLYASVFAVKPQ